MKANAVLFISLFLFGLLECGQAQTNYQRLRSFGFAESLGASPRTAPILASDGRVYGTTFFGGGKRGSDGGGIFRVNYDGTGYRLLHRFSGNHDDVRNLSAPIIEGTDGALYGVTIFGGNNDLGTIFKLNKDGTAFTVLHMFTGTNGDGLTPSGSLTERDGVLYGTTGFGGAQGGGILFGIEKNGTGYQIVHSFVRGGANADIPRGNLVAASDGSFYGASMLGGNGAGTIYKIGPHGAEVLHSFSGPDGSSPFEVVEASDGVLYGTTDVGGKYDAGVIFKVHEDGTGFAVMHDFGDTPTDPIVLYYGVVEGSDGALYGSSYEGGLIGMGAIFRITKDGSKYSIIRDFEEEGEMGGCPYSGLATARDGMLYGVTAEGGAGDEGTVFRISNDGSHSQVLHTFNLLRGGDGESPQADLMEASDGFLYGTTSDGGAFQWGTVFRMHKDGSAYSVLYSFQGIGDGKEPRARLLEASDGQLYGTTASDASNSGGVVFKVKKDGTGFTRLYHFTGYSSFVSNPFAGVIEGSDGALYGTAAFDGTNNGGTVYRLSKDGTQYSVIHRFISADGDGAAPRGSLVRGSDGPLYGTTFAGGSNNNGTVFKLHEDASGYSVLHRFTSEQSDDGRSPAAGLIVGSDHALYGTTTLGGSAAAGTIFKLNEDGGEYSVLHSFSVGPNAPQQPSGSLVERGDGFLYGLTTRGGDYNAGTIFRLNRDGSAFAVVRSFLDSHGDGATPLAALMRASDGALYGATSDGGDFSSGIVFRISAAPWPLTIARLELSGAGALLNFSGGAFGQNYDIEATTTLTPGGAWDPLGSSTAAIDGHFQFLDPAASNNRVRFYRSAVP